MQVGIYELGGNPVILEPGGTSWSLEHREGVVMDGDKTEHLKEFVRVLERYVSAIGVRTFAELKDWETERTDPILNAFARIFDEADNQSRIGNASSMPGDGRHDDDPRAVRRKKRKFYLPGHGIRNLCRWPYQTASLSLLLSSATICGSRIRKGTN